MLSFTHTLRASGIGRMTDVNTRTRDRDSEEVKPNRRGWEAQGPATGPSDDAEPNGFDRGTHPCARPHLAQNALDVRADGAA